MIRWSDKLYKGKGVPPLHEVNWNIRHNAGMAEIYYIVLSQRKDELLEIYPSYVMMQPHLKEKDFYAVGIARGYTYALKLTRDIIDDVYQSTGTFDVEEFFKEDT
ncbi:MAG: hypothetical protein IIZ61_01415 [Lachnospiraceae bacterium]|nr:hypothetical protein [Lachnospiraceae bacterium]